MANSGDIRAGRAFVEIGVDDAPLKKGLADSKASLSSFGESVKGIFGTLKASFSSFKDALGNNDIAGAVTAIFGGQIGGIAMALVSFHEAFPNITRRIGESFGQMGRDFKMTWGGMVDAVKADDLGLAFEISVLGMRSVWADFMAWMAGTFPTLARLYNATYGNIHNGLALGAAMAWDAVNGRFPRNGRGGPGSALRDVQDALIGQQWMEGAGIMPGLREQLAEAARLARARRDAMGLGADDIQRGARGTFSSSVTSGLVGGFGVQQNPWLPRIGQLSADAVRELQRVNRNLEEMRDDKLAFI